MLAETTNLRASFRFPSYIVPYWAGPLWRAVVRQYGISAVLYHVLPLWVGLFYTWAYSPPFTVRTQCSDCLSRDTLNIYEESYMIRRSHISRRICVSALCSAYFVFVTFVVLRKIRCAIELFRMPLFFSLPGNLFWFTRSSDVVAIVACWGVVANCGKRLAESRMHEQADR